MTEQRTLPGMPAAARPHEYEVLAQAPTRCKSCGAELVWAITRVGKTVPCSVATLAYRDGKAYAQSHYRDCPNANDWSRQ